MIGKCHSFLREGGRFFAIWHILYLSHFTYGGGGVQGDLASFTKYAGFFICSLTGVRGILVLISCVCMFVFLSETNLLSLRALSLQLQAHGLFMIFQKLIFLLFNPLLRYLLFSQSLYWMHVIPSRFPGLGLRDNSYIMFGHFGHISILG